MLELTDWFRRANLPSVPWLLLGKGPTFDRRHQFDLSGYNLFALNHVVRELPVDVAHIIDVDVVGECAQQLVSNARWVLMPRYPHLHSAHAHRALEDWFDDYPVLRELDERGRLVWYNLAESGPVQDGSPVIVSRYFSSEAALSILGHLGVTSVRSLGVDGGRAYARTFSALEDETLLTNNATSYDVQFDRLHTVCETFAIDYRPLVEPLRIFVGVEESQLVAYRVLEYSIRKTASIPVEVTPMLDLPHRVPRDAANRPRTSFSFARFAIPGLCGYQGRALYLDADMLVLGDVAELAELAFGDHPVLVSASHGTEQWSGHEPVDNFGAQQAVMLLDCGRLSWDVDEIVDGLDEGRYSYRDLMADLCIVDRVQVAADIPAEWNDLEHYDPGSTRLVHFTVVPTQPWKVDGHPLDDLWMAWYGEAVEAGAVPPEEVESLVVVGDVKPSLRAALRRAPARRAVVTNASLERDGA
ncbi:MAG: glycosyltransferase, partial [Actinomycetota bacterium]